MNETIAIIQARMTSTRLPGKILKNFSNGFNMLDMQLQSLQKVLPRDAIFIATTINKEDDIIEKTYQEHCNIYRGNEKNVLSRFLAIAKKTQAKNIIRIASDNPFIFYEGISSLLNYHTNNKNDYTSFSIENLPAMLVPLGLFVEVLSSKALFDIEQYANDIEKEHVTFALYNRLKNNYKIELIDVNLVYTCLNNKNFRFTVDTLEDFLLIDKIIQDLNIKEINFLIIKKIIEYTKYKNILKTMKTESKKKGNIKQYEKDV